MFVKYVPRTSKLGVHVFGPVHGAIFLAYVVLALVAARVLRWTQRTTLLALVASVAPGAPGGRRRPRRTPLLALLPSVPPMAPVWFERRATRTGRLPRPEVVPA